MSDPTIWLVVVVVLLIAGAGVLIRRRRGRGTPRKAERVDAPATAVADLPSRGTPAAVKRSPEYLKLFGARAAGQSQRKCSPDQARRPALFARPRSNLLFIASLGTSM